tara:strand:- start:103 stop:336 length:234 start_codon:yes stop_codon:yes gene_type:complete
MPDTPTTEEIAAHYSAMGNSVELINSIRASNSIVGKETTAQERQDCIDRNVGHLEIMVAKDYWTTEDMTAVNAAIAG